MTAKRDKKKKSRRAAAVGPPQLPTVTDRDLSRPLELSVLVTELVKAFTELSADEVLGFIQELTERTGFAETSGGYGGLDREFLVLNEKDWSLVSSADLEEVLETEPNNGASYVKLSGEFVAQLGKRLNELGMSEAEAASVAHNVMDNFKGSAGPQLSLDSSEKMDAAVDLALSAIRAAQGATAIFGQAAQISRPPPAPKLWVDRDTRETPTAESFLRQHYGHRLGMEGDLTLADVGRYDTALQTALNREFKGRRHELHALLPTVKERTDQRLLEKYGYVPQGGDRHSKLATMSRERKPAP